MSGTKMTVGSRAQVWHGTAKHTSGGLTKTQLMMNKSGRIVSRKKHASAKRDNRLVKAGFRTKKGHFGFIKVGTRGRGRKGRKGMKGGSGMRPLSNQAWESVDGQGVTNYGGSSNDVQFAAGMSGGGIYGSDAIGADLSNAYDTSDMKGMSGAGIAGAGITNFGAGSIGAQMRAGMAGGKRRKMRGGDGMNGTPESMPLAAALNASGGRRRRRGRKSSMYGGTSSQMTYADPMNPINRALDA